MKIKDNSFKSGLNQDSSKSNYPNNAYIDCTNFRLFTEEGESTGSLENTSGNIMKIYLNNNYLVGSKELGDSIYLFTVYTGTTPYTCRIFRLNKAVLMESTSFTDPLATGRINDFITLISTPYYSYSNTTSSTSTNIAPGANIRLSSDHTGTGEIGQVYKNVSTGTLAVTNATDFLNSANWSNINHLVYEDNSELGLTFSLDYPIQAVSRYETSSIQKLYWVDGNDKLRHINVVYNATTNDLENLPVDKLETLPNFKTSVPEIDSVGTGNLYVGKVQYAYQLYNLNGSESLYSSTTGLFPLYIDTIENDSSKYIYGSDAEENSGKGLKIKITLDTYNGELFTHLRLIRLHYTTLNIDPVISIVKDIAISTDTDIYIYDTGESEGTITLSSFRSKSLGELSFSPETLTSSNNYLITGNETVDYFDIDDEIGYYWDARAYRFDIGSDVNITNREFSSNVPGIKNIISSVSNSGGLVVISTGAVNHELSDGDTVQIIGDVDTYDGIWTITRISATAFSLDDSVYTTGVTSGYIWKILDDDNDCINAHNDFANDSDNGDFGSSACRYKSDGSTLGGEGPNINYKFLTESFSRYGSPLDIESEDGGEQGGYDNYANPYNATYNLSLTRDEIYRFGIVFSDIKGRKSYVKWLGDIRTPRFVDVDMELTSTSTSFDRLYIEFDVNNIPKDADDNYYRVQIVTVPREAKDKSVLAMGLILPLLQRTTGGESFYGMIPNIQENLTNSFTKTCDRQYFASPNNYLIEFLSPEVSTDLITDNDLNSNLYFQTIGATEALHISTKRYYDFFTGSDIKNIRSVAGSGLYKAGVTKYRKIAINDIKKLSVGGSYDSSSTVTNEVGTRSVFNGVVRFARNLFTDNTGYQYQWSKGGTKIYAETEDDLNTIFNTDTDLNTNASIVAGVLKRHISPYGGNSYHDRTKNNYIPYSDIQDSAAEVSKIEGKYGDTYVGYFECMRSLFDLDEFNGNSSNKYTDAGYSELLTFPVESSININLYNWTIRNNINTDYTGDTLTTTSGDFPFWLLQEDSSITGHEAQDGTVAIQPIDMYRYNTVYNQKNNSQLFLPKPDTFSQEVNYTNRIRSSNIKINNSDVDDWLIFDDNTYLDVPSEYGEIKFLTQINNRVFFFQEKGFGTVDVNERALTNTSLGEIELGSSGLLSRYDYISTSTGIKSKNHIINTENGIFWVDQDNATFYSYTNSLENLGEVKNMSSWFKDNITPSSTVNILYDPEYKEILINVNGTTLIYNVKIKAFTAFYTGNPVKGFTVNNKLYSSEDYMSFYEQNSGDKGEFYGATVADSSITLIMPTDKSKEAIFDKIEWVLNYWNSSDNLLTHPEARIRLYNDYQDTGYLRVNEASVTDTISFSTGHAGHVLTFDSDPGLIFDIGDSIIISGSNINDDNYVIESLGTLGGGGSPYLKVTSSFNNETSTSNVTVKSRGSAVRRIRTWRINSIRSVQDEEGSAVTTSNERLRDNYLKIEFNITNSNDNRVVLDIIRTFYRELNNILHT